MSSFDAGLLNDFGGGNVEWWQDYIRSLLGQSEDHYGKRIADLEQELATCKADCTDVAIKIVRETFESDAIDAWKEENAKLNRIIVQKISR